MMDLETTRSASTAVKSFSGKCLMVADMHSAVTLSKKFDSGDSTEGAILFLAKYEENLAMYYILSHLGK
jgi:hypothetical protein